MLVLSFVVVTYALWGVCISGFAVLLAAGVHAYDDAVYTAFNTRIAELTGKEATGHIKGIRNVIRNTVIDLRNSDTMVDDVQSLVGGRRTPTRANILAFYRDVNRKVPGLLSVSERNQMYRLPPFCAEHSAKGRAAIGDAETLGRLAERRGVLAAAQIIEKINEATSPEDLHQVYVIHLNWRRRLRFRALLDIRRLRRGSASLYITYWKRLISYSGKGGGVGVLVSYVMYSAPVMTHLAPAVIGGTMGLFAFVVKSVSVVTAHELPTRWDNCATRFLKRQPLLGVALVGMLSAVLASVYEYSRIKFGH